LDHRSGDRRFDQNVVGASDHDQMLDIISPDQHELALAVEIEHVGHGESRLRPAAAGEAEPLAEQQPPQQSEDQHNDDDGDDRQQYPGGLVA
jgi:hypothetical protein